MHYSVVLSLGGFSLKSVINGVNIIISFRLNCITRWLEIFLRNHSKLHALAHKELLRRGSSHLGSSFFFARRNLAIVLYFHNWDHRYVQRLSRHPASFVRVSLLLGQPHVHQVTKRRKQTRHPDHDRLLENLRREEIAR